MNNKLIKSSNLKLPSVASLNSEQSKIVLFGKSLMFTISYEKGHHLINTLGSQYSIDESLTDLQKDVSNRSERPRQTHMAAILGRTEVGVREFGTSVTIPNDPCARLMYYLDCMCVVLDLNDQENLTRLRNFSQHYLLTEEEIDGLVALCFLLSPDELSGKVIFQDDGMCGESNNSFFELSAVQSNLLVSDSILIGGQRRAVHNIMAFKRQWLQTNWITPMQHFTPRLARIATGQRAQTQRQAITYQSQPTTTNYSRSEDSSCCIIL